MRNHHQKNVSLLYAYELTSPHIIIFFLGGGGAGRGGSVLQLAPVRLPSWKKKIQRSEEGISDVLTATK